MKKLFALILGAAIMISVTACNSDTSIQKPSDSSSSSSGSVEKNWVPEREIDMIIAYSAGGGNDRMFRGFQPYLEERLGQSTNPVYLPGAEGLIGWTSLMSSEPDGYHVGILSIPNATGSIVTGDAAFTVDSFEYFGSVTYEPPLLIVNKNNPWGINTFDDFVNYAKEHPGEVTIAHTGTGGDEYVAIRIMAQKLGLDVKDIPYEDTASAAASLLGGHIYAQVSSAYGVLNYLQQDQVIPLAMACEERMPAFPEIPTFKENNLDLILGGMRGIVGPKGMDQEVIDFWVKTIEDMMTDPEYLAYAEESGTMVLYMGPEEFKAAHQNLYEEYKALYEVEPW